MNLYNAGQDTIAIKSHKCYNDLLDHYKNSFSWKVGTYNAKFSVIISENNQIFNHSFAFRLSSLDIKSLEQNIERCKLFAEKEYVDGKIEIESNWYWVNTEEIRND